MKKNVCNELAENCGNCEEVQWMSRSELGVLVYLVSVRHSMHAGYMDKAHKYTEKALSQISKIRGKSNISPCSNFGISD